MDFLLEHLVPYLITYQYFFIFIISFLSCSFLPIPLGSLLIATGTFASQGQFDIKLVILVTIMGTFLGDSFGYFMAWYYGEKVFLFIGFNKILKSKTFNVIEERFRRHPCFIVLASRFEVLSTLTINTLSGLGKISFRKYLLFGSIGNILSVFFYTFIGYGLGYNWQIINTTMRKVYFVCVLLCIILIVSFWNRIKELLVYK
jgi:membrane-associated protein